MIPTRITLMRAPLVTSTLAYAQEHRAQGHPRLNYSYQSGILTGVIHRIQPSSLKSGNTPKMVHFEQDLNPEEEKLRHKTDPNIVCNCPFCPKGEFRGLQSVPLNERGARQPEAMPGAPFQPPRGPMPYPMRPYSSQYQPRPQVIPNLPTADPSKYQSLLPLSPDSSYSNNSSGNLESKPTVEYDPSSAKIFPPFLKIQLRRELKLRRYQRKISIVEDDVDKTQEGDDEIFKIHPNVEESALDKRRDKRGTMNPEKIKKHLPLQSPVEKLRKLVKNVRRNVRKDVLFPQSSYRTKALENLERRSRADSRHVYKPKLNSTPFTFMELLRNALLLIVLN
ncbi:hypothetical protein KQX54_001673 [Cotesia glomerata]|uniref:Uncharacterized protein n=1 Tax=Cotesia glomerata TaxID=32391 RepID=A0AAV7HSW6_COTGL|nr:hypothetical protein KQX54_001673 [Cotesia glomerata]